MSRPGRSTASARVPHSATILSVPSCTQKSELYLAPCKKIAVGRSRSTAARECGKAVRSAAQSVAFGLAKVPRGFAPSSGVGSKSNSLYANFISKKGMVPSVISTFRVPAICSSTPFTQPAHSKHPSRISGLVSMFIRSSSCCSRAKVVLSM